MQKPKKCQNLYRVCRLEESDELWSSVSQLSSVMVMSDNSSYSSKPMYFLHNRCLQHKNILNVHKRILASGWIIMSTSNQIFKKWMQIKKLGASYRNKSGFPSSTQKHLIATGSSMPLQDCWHTSQPLKLLCIFSMPSFIPPYALSYKLLHSTLWSLFQDRYSPSVGRFIGPSSSSVLTQRNPLTYPAEFIQCPTAQTHTVPSKNNSPDSHSLCECPKDLEFHRFTRVLGYSHTWITNWCRAINSLQLHLQLLLT